MKDLDLIITLKINRTLFSLACFKKEPGQRLTFSELQPLAYVSFISSLDI